MSKWPRLEQIKKYIKTFQIIHDKICTIWVNRLKKHFFPAQPKKYSSYQCELGGAYPVGVSDWTSWDNVGTGRVFPLCVLVDGIVVHAVKRLLFHRTDTLHKSHLRKQTRRGKQGRVWNCGGQRGPNYSKKHYFLQFKHTAVQIMSQPEKYRNPLCWFIVLCRFFTHVILHLFGIFTFILNSL